MKPMQLGLLGVDGLSEKYTLYFTSESFSRKNLI